MFVIQSILNMTKTKFNNDEFTVTAPGKIILFGEHSVVYGFKAIAVSLKNMRTIVKASLLDEEVLDMETPKFSIKIPINKLKKIKFDNLDLNNPKFDASVLNLIKQEIINDRDMATLATIFLFMYLLKLRNE
jgi:mevalonate kinase